jgi:hypothetical protein
MSDASAPDTIDSTQEFIYKIPFQDLPRCFYYTIASSTCLFYSLLSFSYWLALLFTLSFKLDYCRSHSPVETNIYTFPAMYFTKSFIAATAFMSAAYAANHQIQVGTGGLRVFTPSTVNAAVGDTVQFVFVAGVC